MRSIFVVKIVVYKKSACKNCKPRHQLGPERVGYNSIGFQPDGLRGGPSRPERFRDCDPLREKNTKK
jgi:hypothetical protein